MLVAILVFGGIFGFARMLLGVPVFAVLYTVIGDRVNKRLARKHHPQQTSLYYTIRTVDDLPPVTEPSYTRALPRSLPTKHRSTRTTIWRSTIRIMTISPAEPERRNPWTHFLPLPPNTFRESGSGFVSGVLLVWRRYLLCAGAGRAAAVALCPAAAEIPAGAGDVGMARHAGRHSAPLTHWENILGRAKAATSSWTSRPFRARTPS